MTKRARLVVLLYGLLAVTVFPVFPHFVSPNEFSRWVLVSALAERGSFEVSKEADLLGPRFEDLAVTEDGRVFSNKAPGLALASAPGYLVARPFVGPPSRESTRASLTAMRLFGATLPVLLLAWLLRRAAASLGAKADREAPVLFALLFATPLFAYGMQLFSHALVASCLFAAWALLFLDGERRALREVLAGGLLGLAVASEYPMVLPALLLVGASALRRDLPRVVRVGLGGLPFALLVAAYNTICFGGPLVTSYRFEKIDAYREIARGGFFGIGAPSHVLQLLLDPSKGLLLFSPFLLLLVKPIRRLAGLLPRDAFVGLVAAPLGVLVLYAGYPGWHGGWTLGPRFLVAALPFAVFPLFFRDGSAFEFALIGAGAVAVAIASLVFPFIPRDFPLPWGSFAWPLLRQGLVTPNLGHLLAPALGVLLPFALVAAAAAAGVPRRSLLAFAGGALVWAVAGAVASRFATAPGFALQRGFIAEAYFDRDGALAASAPSIPPRLRSRLSETKALPPPGWP